MKKFITKALSAVTACALAFTLAVPSTTLTVNAATSKTQSTTKTVNYVALGDSITEPSNGYVSIVGKGIGATSVKNFGVSGWDSTDIYRQVKTATDVRAALRKADVVTLDVGSNDMTRKLGDIICDTLPCGKSYEAFNAKVTAMQREYNRATGYKKVLLGVQMMYKAYQIRNAVYSTTNINAVNNTFKNNLTGTIKEIKTLNPNAKIYVGNLYNPYNTAEDIKIAGYKVLDQGEVIELWEKTLNKTIASVASSTGCTLVDIHPLFKDSSLTIGDGKNNWDPHPNSAGHQAIAKAFLSKMK